MCVTSGRCRHLGRPVVTVGARRRATEARQHPIGDSEIDRAMAADTYVRGPSGSSGELVPQVLRHRGRAR